MNKHTHVYTYTCTDVQTQVRATYQLPRSPRWFTTSILTIDTREVIALWKCTLHSKLKQYSKGAQVCAAILWIEINLFRVCFTPIAEVDDSVTYTYAVCIFVHYDLCISMRMSRGHHRLLCIICVFAVAAVLL